VTKLGDEFAIIRFNILHVAGREGPAEPFVLCQGGELQSRYSSGSVVKARG
jgi:hypothetical protein